MKTFENIDGMWIDMLTTILQDGHRCEARNGGSTELLGYSGRILDPRACFLFCPGRRLPVSYPAAELLWLLFGRRDVEMIKHYAPRYENFANDGEVHGHYGYRWRGGDDAFDEATRKIFADSAETITKRKSGYSDRKGKYEDEYQALMEPLLKDRIDGQLRTLLELLRQKPNTRQGVLTAWNAGDLLFSLAGVRKDIPCTLSWQFFIRDGKLNLITTMRSNDVWIGTPNDVYCFCHLQQLVASALNVGLGWYQHQVGSLHLYDWDAAKLDRVWGVEYGTEPLVYQPIGPTIDEYVESAREEEEWARTQKVLRDHLGDTCGGENALLAQNLFMAATKFMPEEAAKRITCSDLLRKRI